MSGDYVLSRFIITVHMQIYESYKNKLYLILEHITFTCMHLADAFFLNTFFFRLLFFSYQTSFLFLELSNGNAKETRCDQACPVQLVTQCGKIFSLLGYIVCGPVILFCFYKSLSSFIVTCFTRTQALCISSAILYQVIY